MEGRRPKIIRVPKAVSVALLAVTSLLMAGLVFALSGKAYAADTHPLRELAARLLGSGRAPGTLLPYLMPVLGNMLLFAPWGFLFFVVVDASTRPRPVAYLMTLVIALLFAGAMYVWQGFLPTRVTSLPDALSNALGALAGASLGHMRKTVRVHFEV
jgi:hypothetical protein